MNAAMDPSNISVTRLCYPSGEGSQKLRTVAITEEKVAFMVPPFVRNCSVEMLQGDTVLAIGSVSFQCKNYAVMSSVGLQAVLQCVSPDQL